MQIVLNGHSVEIVTESLAELLESSGVDATRSGVAVAVNERIVTRPNWASTLLSAGDSVEIITAMQGG